MFTTCSKEPNCISPSFCKNRTSEDLNQKSQWRFSTCTCVLYVEKENLRLSYADYGWGWRGMGVIHSAAILWLHWTFWTEEGLKINSAVLLTAQSPLFFFVSQWLWRLPGWPRLQPQGTRAQWEWCKSYPTPFTFAHQGASWSQSS